MRILHLIFALALALSAPAHASQKSDYLRLAKKGWSYQLRVAMRKDASIPVHINGRDFIGSSICVVGDHPHPNTSKVLTGFLTLLEHTFSQPVELHFAGQSATNCTKNQTIVLRLYSGHPPNRAFSADLQWLNQLYKMGLPKNREYSVSSPAQAQTYFGYNGTATHIMVKQPALQQIGELEQAFYTSILLEELFQSFTFGMDVLQFNPSAPFLSKLQETPLNLHRLLWGSRKFMRALLNSNPMRLCQFDVFMMHAIAVAPVDQTNDPQFITFIDQNYETLHAKSTATLSDPRFADILDPSCAQHR